MLLPADSSPQSHLWSLIHLLLMVCGTGWLGAARRRWGSHKWRHTFKIPFSLSYCKKKEEKVGVALHESFFFFNIHTLIFSSSPYLLLSLPLSIFLSSSLCPSRLQFSPSPFHSFPHILLPFPSISPVSLQKRAIFPWISTKHGKSSCFKTRHLASYWGRKRQTSKSKWFLKQRKGSETAPASTIRNPRKIAGLQL